MQDFVHQPDEAVDEFRMGLRRAMTLIVMAMLTLLSIEHQMLLFKASRMRSLGRVRRKRH